MIDAHNHLQQFADPDRILAEARQEGVTAMLVNGTCEQDWSEVEELAHRHPEVIPSFGLHPWQVPERSPNWQAGLREFLLRNPQAALGECGLDRWKKPFNLTDQIECLQFQLNLAHELQRPVTIHCLQAWGPLLDLLSAQSSLPPFLLHAYSGSQELVAPFSELGAYFSFNGYFLHKRKAKIRDTFYHIPSDRLLLESDAPSMLPPPSQQFFTLPNNQNHPGNLKMHFQALVPFLGEKEETLGIQLAKNFQNFHLVASS